MSEQMFTARHAPGVVILVLDHTTADAMATAWEHAHDTGLITAEAGTFNAWDVATLKTAAADAKAEADELEQPTSFPDQEQPPALRLVGVVDVVAGSGKGKPGPVTTPTPESEVAAPEPETSVEPRQGPVHPAPRSPVDTVWPWAR